MHKYTSVPYTRATHSHAAIFLENLFSIFQFVSRKFRARPRAPAGSAEVDMRSRDGRHLRSWSPDAITTRRGLRKGKKWNLATLLLYLHSHSHQALVIFFNLFFFAKSFFFLANSNFYLRFNSLSNALERCQLIDYRLIKLSSSVSHEFSLHFYPENFFPLITETWKKLKKP